MIAGTYVPSDDDDDDIPGRGSSPSASSAAAPSAANDGDGSNDDSPSDEEWDVGKEEKKQEWNGDDEAKMASRASSLPAQVRCHCRTHLVKASDEGEAWTPGGAGITGRAAKDSILIDTQKFFSSQQYRKQRIAILRDMCRHTLGDKIDQEARQLWGGHPHLRSGGNGGLILLDETASHDNLLELFGRAQLRQKKVDHDLHVLSFGMPARGTLRLASNTARARAVQGASDDEPQEWTAPNPNSSSSGGLMLNVGGRRTASGLARSDTYEKGEVKAWLMQAAENDGLSVTGPAYDHCGACFLLPTEVFEPVFATGRVFSFVL